MSKNVQNVAMLGGRLRSTALQSEVGKINLHSNTDEALSTDYLKKSNAFDVLSDVFFFFSFK